MRYALQLHTPPTSEPLTFADAQDQLRLPTADEHDLVERYIKAARQYFEEHDDRRLITQTYKLFLDCFPCVIDIPLRPLQSVTHIKYVNPDGVLTTLSDTLYIVDKVSFRPRITPAYGQIWPSTRLQANAVEIQFVCGYANAAAVPEHLKHALLLHVGHMYENREETLGGERIGRLPLGYRSLVGAGRAVHV